MCAAMLAVAVNNLVVTVVPEGERAKRIAVAMIGMFVMPFVGKLPAVLRKAIDAFKAMGTGTIHPRNLQLGAS